MIYTKLGIHIMATGQFEAGRILRTVPPAVTKFILPIDGGFWNGVRVPEVQDCQPGTLVIGKPLHGTIILGVGLGEEYRAGYTPDQVAEAYWTKYQAPMLDAYPRVDAWEVFNEFEHDTELDAGAQYTWYAQCCAAMAKRLWQVGKRGAICALATHRPNLSQFPDWERWYLPALAACRSYGAIFTRHGYDAGYPSPDGSLRYRDDLQRFIRLGYPDVKMVITECGWDWPPIHDRPTSVSDYVRDYCIPYERLLREDPGVIGATLYCYGTGGANKQFDAADPKNEFADAWIEFALANALTSDPPVPPVPPPLQPDQYRVHNCSVLNVRGHPWGDNLVSPPLVGQLLAGSIVTVYDTTKFGDMVHPWAAISKSGSQWVRSDYLTK